MGHWGKAVTSGFEVVAGVVVVMALPAVARLGWRASKGPQAAALMMGLGFVFATLFEAKPPQVTEKSIKREDEDAQRERGPRVE